MKGRIFLKTSFFGACILLSPLSIKHNYKFIIPNDCPFENLEFMKRIDDYCGVAGMGIKVYKEGKRYRLVKAISVNCNKIPERLLEKTKHLLYKEMCEKVEFMESVKRCSYSMYSGQRYYKTISGEFIFV